jgi:hypothetical protein
MDFRQANQTPVNRPEVTAAAPATPHGAKKVKGSDGSPQWLSWLNVVILFGAAILLTLIAFSFSRADTKTGEDKYVDTAKYQAVFLNNGQVYFGRIASLNTKYVDLVGVYYLTQNTTTAGGQQQASGDYTLVKLGCQQIHNPDDRMLINRDQVTFWENLNKDGKVAKSIEEFKKQNPKGPNCSETSTQTQSSNNTNTQGSTAPSNTQTNGGARQ